jgi:hypothetical protein
MKKKKKRSIRDKRQLKRRRSVDLDIMWSVFNKYRPMLDEAYEKWAEKKAPIGVDDPYLDGEGSVGAVLTCTMGNWEGEPTGYAYRWLSDEEAPSAPVAADADQDAVTPETEPIGRPTQHAFVVLATTDVGQYQVTEAAAGHSVTCIVIATNEFGTTESAPSNAIAIPALS